MNSQDKVHAAIKRGESDKHYWLYVLRLVQDKYYVGITAKTPEARLKEHIDGFMGARWTKKYEPENLFDKKDLGYMTLAEAESYENKVVRMYMAKYGFNNVHGGDLRYSGGFVKRFGWYIAEKDWEVFTVVVFLLLVIFTLGLLSWLR